MLNPALGAQATTNTLIASDRRPSVDITYRGAPALAATVPELQGLLVASSVADNSLQATAAAAAVKAGIVVIVRRHWLCQ